MNTGTESGGQKEGEINKKIKNVSQQPKFAWMGVISESCSWKPILERQNFPCPVNPGAWVEPLLLRVKRVCHPGEAEDVGKCLQSWDTSRDL